MSFDDYAEYITQKYRLSTAIAIIKSKPENQTAEQYLNELKNKIHDKMDDNFDISIHSDDFNIDDDTMMADDDELMNISETILRDMNFENDDPFNDPDVCADQNVGESTLELPQVSTPCISENLTQTTLNPNPLTQAEYNPNIIQSIDNNDTYCDLDNNITKNINEKDTLTDTQKTLIYTVYGFTQNSHYSPSQTNISIPKEHIYGNNNNRHITKDVLTGNCISKNETGFINDVRNREHVNTDNIAKNNIPNTTNKDIINYTEKITSIDTAEGRHVPPVSNDNANSWNIIKYAMQDSLNANEEDLISDRDRKSTIETLGSKDILNIYHKNSCTQKKDINTLKNVTNDKRNMNQRGVVANDDRQSIQITFNNSRNENIIIEAGASNIPKDVNQNFDKYNDENVIQHNNLKAKHSSDTHNNVLNHLFKNIDTTKAIQPSCTVQNHSHTQDNNNITINNNEINNSSGTATKLMDAMFENSQNTDIFSQNHDIFYDNNMENKTEGIELIKDINGHRQVINPKEDTTEEVIPFKILEEFNKVKSYLCRNDRRMSSDSYFTDSGYRSDSQGRTSKSALQLSGNWLNQSGHCLFDHIMSCHLVVSTRDITNEIAQVLGKLIDRLHEEEKYPTFMEALLEANNKLLRQLYEGENSNENALLNRDENIQRLTLLNKSIHIQKYCIEKITEILVEYHSKLTDSESIFELKNIDQMENLYYIFHLLEILLQKYNKSKDMLSQASTQPSQDEGIFKKSSITDLWKRKWNPNYQDGGGAGNGAKTCVLRACCEILNKIIVDSLSSYSLVSYVALKCFNLTQS